MNTVLLIAVLSIVGSLTLLTAYLLALRWAVRYIEHTSPIRRLRQADADIRAVLDYAGESMEDIINQWHQQQRPSRRSDFNIASRWSEWN